MQLGMCSGSGVCDYDTSKGRARCFCDLGSSGASCESSGDKGLPPSTNYSPIITGGFFGSLFGGIIIAVGCLALRTRVRTGRGILPVRVHASLPLFASLDVVLCYYY